MAAALPLLAEGIELAGGAIAGYAAGRATQAAQGRFDRFVDRKAKKAGRSFRRFRDRYRHTTGRAKQGTRGIHRASTGEHRFLPRHRQRAIRRLGPPSMPYKRLYSRYRRGRRRYGRRRKRYARFSRKRIGMPVGSGSCKTVEIENTIGLQMATRNLVQTPLCQIDRATDHEIDRRERDIVNIRGIKMCLFFRNTSSVAPVVVHVAVVVPKAETVVNDANFFRAYGTTRSVNADTTEDSNTWHCFGINTDLHTVIMHKKFQLIGTSQSSMHSNNYNPQRGASYRRFVKYLKIKRQVRYDGAVNTPVSQSPVLLFWCDFISADSAQGSISGTVLYDEHIVTYFRDPRC